MANRTRFAGRFRALDYNYGGGPTNVAPPSLSILTAPATTGSGSVTLENAILVLTDGNTAFPLNVNAPVLVGSGSNQETVTPTAVTNVTSTVPGQPGFTATFANLHGIGDPVASASFGLQEAVNDALSRGGGIVVVDPEWYSVGGTAKIIQAVVLPTNGSVQIEDVSTSPTIRWVTSPNSLTVVSAPVAATSATVASQPGVTGTWTAVTEHVLFTYVTADGGETVASSDYSFTATASVAIGGSGPAASTGAVGYKVYIGTNATTTCYQVPVIAANGTVIQCGPIAAFKLGTAFSVALATTSAGNLIPVQNTAFPTGVQPVASPNMAELFAAVTGPFTATGSVTSTVTEMARVAFPTAFLNQVGRTVRVKYIGSWTPAGTAKLILTISLTSVYTGTATTMWTVTTAASSGAAIANLFGELYLCTAATGATGTVEAHGVVQYCGATATPQVLISAGDSVQAVSSSIDLTKQNYLTIGISSDATITTSQMRLVIVEVLQ